MPIPRLGREINSGSVLFWVFEVPKLFNKFHLRWNTLEESLFERMHCSHFQGTG